MKMIIDIPELDYECAKQRWMRGNDAHKMDYYISKGIPLDKIRAEISVLDDADYDYEGYYKAVTDALHIIDKYNAESEE